MSFQNDSAPAPAKAVMRHEQADDVMSDPDSLSVGVQPGAVVGEFVVGEQIGAGGLARVYRAWQTSLNRDVALKVTDLRSSDSDAPAEGRVMAGLQHDGIVDVYAELTTESCHVLAMQLVEGPSLMEVIAALHGGSRGASGRSASGRSASGRSESGRSESGRSESACRDLVRDLADRQRPRESGGDTGVQSECPGQGPSARRCEGRLATLAARCGRSQRDDVVSFACRTVWQVALALQYTHERGVFHGDVKPANVLFSREVRPLLTDFNVSARIELPRRSVTAGADPGRETQASQTTGTPAGGTLLYMAPEQLAAVIGLQSETVIDGRADVYALGLVLFEFLTGRWPFPEAGLGGDPLLAPRQLYASRLAGEVEFSEGGVRVPAALKAIVRHCLRSAPNERYQSAAELAEDLQRFLEQRPLRWAERAGVVRQSVLWLTRHRSSVTVTGLLTALSVTLALLSVGREPDVADVSPELLRSQAMATDETPADAALRFERARQLEQAGRTALLAGQDQQAALDLQQAVTLNPEDPVTQHNLGIALFRTGRFAAAEAAFDAAIGLGVRNGRVFSYRAAARYALGNLAGAQQDFDCARQLAEDQERAEVDANYRAFVARFERH